MNIQNGQYQVKTASN